MKNVTPPLYVSRRLKTGNHDAAPLAISARASTLAAYSPSWVRTSCTAEIKRAYSQLLSQRYSASILTASLLFKNHLRVADGGVDCATQLGFRSEKRSEGGYASFRQQPLGGWRELDGSLMNIKVGGCIGYGVFIHHSCLLDPHSLFLSSSALYQSFASLVFLIMYYSSLAPDISTLPHPSTIVLQSPTHPGSSIHAINQSFTNRYS